MRPVATVWLLDIWVRAHLRRPRPLVYFNKLRTLLLREHRSGVFRAYESFFEEFVGRSAVHLKLPNLSGNASLYCHQKQLASEESFASITDICGTGSTSAIWCRRSTAGSI